MNFYITTLFYISKILHLIPLKISRNLERIQFAGISITKLSFSLVFYIFCNAHYTLNALFFFSKGRNDVMKFTGISLIPTTSLCHLVAVSTCLYHRKKVFLWIFCNNQIKYIAFSNKKEITLLSTMGLLPTTNLLYMIFVIYNFNFGFIYYISSFTWFIVHQTTYVVCLHFLTIMQHLQRRMHAINVMSLSTQTLFVKNTKLLPNNSSVKPSDSVRLKLKSIMNQHWLLYDFSTEVNRV